MSINDISIKPDVTIRKAMNVINSGGLGAVFVVDDSGKFNRILTEEDIRNSLLDGHGLQSCIDVIPFTEAIFADESISEDEIEKLSSKKSIIIPILDNEHKIVDYHLCENNRYLPVAKPMLDAHELELVSECVITGWVSSGGSFVNQFEELMATYCHTEYAISCSSATTGLHLSLLASGIGHGDEVIIPTLTFIATANAVSYTGAKPVLVDSEPKTWNIDPAKIREAITSKTKAIIPVHLYGHPADMDMINDIAREYNLMVIEDAAEAQGATHKGKPVGALSDVAVFSYFGNKIITTGEGGMIVTNNKEIAEKSRILRDHGMSPERRYWHEVIGYNYRMTNIQAALGVAQMGKIDRIIKRKKEIAKQYEVHLQNISGITLPKEMPWAVNIYWLYTILVDEDLTGCSIEYLMSILRSNEIESRPFFPPIHKQPAYVTSQTFPVAEKISSSGISLPSFPELKNEDIEKICSLIISNV